MDNTIEVTKDYPLCLIDKSLVQSPYYQNLTEPTLKQRLKNIDHAYTLLSTTYRKVQWHYRLSVISYYTAIFSIGSSVLAYIAASCTDRFISVWAVGACTSVIICIISWRLTKYFDTTSRNALSTLFKQKAKVIQAILPNAI